MMNDKAQKRVRKAIIPIAGNGTRMFPETFFIKKVMLPVMDADGVVKPALLYMLEELVGCGIDEIYLIVGEGETDDYERMFNFSFDAGFEGCLPEKVRGYYKRIHEMGRRIRLVVQKEKKGFGHAVYQARQFLDGEPAALLLGDFLYKSSSDRSCTQQVIDAYEASGGKAAVGIRRVYVKDCRNYGVLHGSFRADDTSILDVDMMVEKPDEEYAVKNLLVDGGCYATFGNYVLTDEIFEHVGKLIDEKDRRGDTEETDLTGSFSYLASKGNLIGVRIEGDSFDVGLPEMYYRTFTEFGK